MRENDLWEVAKMSDFEDMIEAIDEIDDIDEAYDLEDDTEDEEDNIVSKLNQLVDRLNGKLSDETPGFRLYDDVDTSEADADTIGIVNTTYQFLKGHNYQVDVIEDLDIKNVTSEDRYKILIKNINNNIEFKFSLIKFRESLLDYEFEPDVFIINILQRIEGAKGNEELNTIKESILHLLSYVIHYKELFKYEYETIGWDRASFDGKTRIFKYDNIISNSVEIKGDIKEKYKDLYSHSIADDAENRWKGFTIGLMNNHVYDSMIFAISISGLIRQILTFTKESNLNINIKGAPGSGKSSITNYALSFWGAPNLLQGASIDTENAADRIRAERPVLPYILDERMLRFFSESDKKQRTELLLEVFREYEGREKERLGKQYESTKGVRIYGPIISSSVDSMLDMLREIKDIGQYRRFIEFDIKSAKEQHLFNSEEATKAEEISNGCYGFGIKYVIRYMLLMFEVDDRIFENEFQELTARFRDVLTEEQKMHNITDMASSSMRFALVILSYRVLRRSFIYDRFYTSEGKSCLTSGKYSTNKEYIDSVINANPCEERTIAIKSIIEAFNSYIEDDGNNILIDQEAEIERILIENLLIKLIGLTVSNKRNLHGYISKLLSSQSTIINTDFETWKNERVEYLCVKKTNKEYELFFEEAYHFEKLLLKHDVPDFEDIAARLDNGDSIDDINKEYNAVTSREIKEICDANEYKLTRTTITTSPTRVSGMKITIPLIVADDTEEEEEEV